jgi:hypothetical protein
MRKAMPQDSPLTALVENEPSTDSANTDVGQYCAICPQQDISVVFDPNGSSIDAEVEEYAGAEDLTFTEISGNDTWSFDGVIDAYNRKYGEEKLAELLAIFTAGGSGGGLVIL